MEKNYNSAQAIQARINGRLKQKNTSSGDTAQSSGLSPGLSVLATCASTEGQQTWVEASKNNALEEGSDSDSDSDEEITKIAAV